MDHFLISVVLSVLENRSALLLEFYAYCFNFFSLSFLSFFISESIFIKVLIHII